MKYLFLRSSTKTNYCVLDFPFIFWGGDSFKFFHGRKRRRPTAQPEISHCSPPVPIEERNMVLLQAKTFWFGTPLMMFLKSSICIGHVAIRPSSCVRYSSFSWWASTTKRSVISNILGVGRGSILDDDWLLFILLRHLCFTSCLFYIDKISRRERIVERMDNNRLTS